ncbi:conserved hypothetical protein [Phenylobacterium zucineum HLK1]|uniref:DUF427 domain-containing protein n=1 Tax=Phenylobacterium zucineum (strain HLK1) TaxID=450851 RepID=B4REW3_PHEZH|nr:DUF427 domain-containing protein [Phenylobacterium zucineum]ACG76951.1 conserved hypothetical protein [Phenylobacterium zucineum HLK1]
MLTPGPDHPITVEPARNRWRARFAGHVIADSDDVLILQEANLAPVVYFPRDDVAMEYMGRSDHVTHCPYKGDATYYTLRMESYVEDDVAWSYESPAEAVARINGRIAFYPDRVEVYEVDDAAVNPKHDREDDAAREDVDAVVQHTDSGAGTSQREHWEPNVEGPGGGLR